MLNCKKCGNELLGNRKVYCSDKCAKAFVKRFREKVVSSSIEKINRLSLFKEFGWKCKECGCDTPHSLINTTDRKAPQLDHIIPISKGGQHIKSNLQLLCRECNIRKSNKMPDESALIAITSKINVIAVLNYINKHSYAR